MMNIGYTLHMPLWSRIKLLFGWGLRVEVKDNHKELSISTCVVGEEADLVRMFSQSTEDPRKTGLKNGLRQLTAEQLQRVIDYPGEMVLDTYNYEDGKFCALAIGVGLDKSMVEPTHQKVFDILTSMGYNVYNTRGIPGEFYTNNRLEDLLEAAREVLQEKNANK